MTPTHTLPPFPNDIGEWWWEEAQSRWPDLSEDKLLNLLRQEIVKQSDRFNKFRNFDCDAYGKRDLSILAYGNFYFSRTWSAMAFSMAEALYLRGWVPPQKGPIRVLDLGSGTGASGLSCLQILRNAGIENHIQLEAVDYSSKSLAFLKKLHASKFAHWSNTRISTKKLDLRFLTEEMDRRKYDLILLGFSINELICDDQKDDDEFYKKLLFSLPGFLKTNGFAVITEPAEKDTCHLLHQKCFELVNSHKELHLHSPYFNDAFCSLAQRKAKYFSHEVRKILPFFLVEKINRPLNLEIRKVKFGLSIIGLQTPKPIGREREVCRIISPIKKRKGTVSFIGMNHNGTEYKYELQRRFLSKKEVDDLMQLNRGDILELKNTEIDEQSDRIRIEKYDDLLPLFTPRQKE